MSRALMSLHRPVRAPAHRRVEGNGLVWTGVALLAFLVLVALFAPLIAPYDPRAFDAEPLLEPSSAHPLGTNDAGQDLFSQLVHGTRDALLVAPLAATLTVMIGVAIGAAAAIAGGGTDVLLSRVTDVTMALPRLPMLILIAVAARPSAVTVVLSIALLSWPLTARIVRVQLMTLRNRPYVTAARGFGAGPGYLARRHLLPAIGPILVSAFVSAAALAVLLDAGLSFLGLSDPSRSSWGLMMNDALNYSGLFFGDAWIWWLLPPGVALTALILGFTFFGVGLEPRLNPRLREHLS